MQGLAVPSTLRYENKRMTSVLQIFRNIRSNDTNGDNNNDKYAFSCFRPVPRTLQAFALFKPYKKSY